MPGSGMTLFSFSGCIHVLVLRDDGRFGLVLALGFRLVLAIGFRTSGSFSLSGSGSFSPSGSGSLMSLDQNVVSGNIITMAGSRDVVSGKADHCNGLIKISSRGRPIIAMAGSRSTGSDVLVVVSLVVVIAAKVILNMYLFTLVKSEVRVAVACLSRRRDRSKCSFSKCISLLKSDVRVAVVSLFLL